MKQRFFKSIKIRSLDDFDIEFGVVNRNNPEVVFINCKTYLSSLTQVNSFVKLIHEKLAKMKKVALSKLKGNDTFDENTMIFDFCVTQTFNDDFKNKILCVELFLKQKNGLKKKISEMQGCVESYLDSFLKELSSMCLKNNITVSKVKTL